MKSLDTTAVMPTITCKKYTKIFRFKQAATEAVKAYTCTLIEEQNTTGCNLTLIAKFTNYSYMCRNLSESTISVTGHLNTNRVNGVFQASTTSVV